MESWRKIIRQALGYRVLPKKWRKIVSQNSPDIYDGHGNRQAAVQEKATLMILMGDTPYVPFTSAGSAMRTAGIIRAFVLFMMIGMLQACTGGAPELRAIDEPASAQPLSLTGGAVANDKGNEKRRHSGRKLKVVKTLPPPPQTQGGRIQLLSPGDELEVTFFGIKKLDREVKVDSTGNISLPLIGNVKAAGKTTRQLERDLARIYGKSYLQNPQISVNVKKSMGQRVTVNGEVRLPGIYPIGPNTTLLQALALARGFNDIGDPSKVFVFRKINGQQLVAQYNAEAIQAGRQENPRIYGGDIVVTFPSNTKVAMRNLQTILGLAQSSAALAVIP